MNNTIIIIIALALIFAAALAYMAFPSSTGEPDTAQVVVSPPEEPTPVVMEVREIKQDVLKDIEREFVYEKAEMPEFEEVELEAI